MNSNNPQLLCTFCYIDTLDTTISDIIDNYDLVFNKIFILEDSSYSTDELICTYNISNSNTNYHTNTISIHRKKETNTLYTINALNELIRELNNGYLDIMYKINWVDYKNCVILIRDNMLYKINTKIYNIIHTDD